ncbi:MAG: galactokinase, partial [Bacteroidales bacterium]|nr:galactokinase [Bacteroidales bacterium]
MNTNNSNSLERVKAAHEAQFGNDYRLFSAPGRINIIGEHTDYNEGFVLPAAIDKKIYLAIKETNDSKVNLFALDMDESTSFDLNKPQPELPHWAKYVFGVIKELEVLGSKVSGFNATFGGDIPAGAGLSSSAALESVFGFALNEIFRLNRSTLQLAKVGQMAEHNYAGVNCGIMDQFASLHGKAGKAIKLDCRSLEYEYFTVDTGDYEFILTDTHVKHSLAESAYNKRRYECEEGVMLLQSQMVQVHSLRDVKPKDVEAYENILGEEIMLRCLYVTEEIERVRDAAEAMEANDLARLGELMYKSHTGLRNQYMVSCDELDLLVDLTKDNPDVLGSRMMGGGFGGCTLSLVKSSGIEAFKKTATENYQKTFG